MKNIVFDHVDEAYDKNVIVKDLNMEIREGERLILLGLRLRQIHHPADDCGPGEAQRGKSLYGRPSGKRCSLRGEECVHGISKLCPVSSYDGAKQYRLRPKGPQNGSRGDKDQAFGGSGYAGPEKGWRSAGQRIFPAASARGWRWPGQW